MKNVMRCLLPCTSLSDCELSLILWAHVRKGLTLDNIIIVRMMPECSQASMQNKSRASCAKQH